MQRQNQEPRPRPLTGLPRTGVVVEAENGRIIVSNTLSQEIIDGFRRNPPLELNREDNRTLPQIVTTAFAAYTANGREIDFNRANQLFQENVALARANPQFVERIGAQYDRLIALGVNLPFLQEPNGRTPVQVTRDRYIDMVGATTLLAARHIGTGEVDENENANQVRLMDNALRNPAIRARNMNRLHRRWMDNYVNTNDTTTIDNPYEFVAALTAKAMGPRNFFNNYLEVCEAAGDRRALRADQLTITTTPPERINQTTPNTPEVARRVDRVSLEKKLGGMIYESKARKEENRKVLKAIILMGETFTDFTLAYANLRMFSHLNSIAQDLNNTLMDQDKRGIMHSISNLNRKLTIMGAVYEYTNTKFQAEREGIRNGKTNGWNLFAGLAASNFALDYVNTHFIKKGLPADEMFSIPIAPFFYFEKPDLTGIGKLMTLSQGTFRLSATKGFHKVKTPTQEESTRRTWKDIEKTAGTVRDMLDRLDDGFTLWNVASAVMNQVIPDNVRTNWVGGRVISALDNMFVRWAASAEDVSDLAEIPEVLAGLIEAYAGMVNESLSGSNALTGSQSQIIRDVINRYIANNNSDNDYVIRTANRFLTKLGLPPVGGTNTPPVAPTPTPTPITPLNTTSPRRPRAGNNGVPQATQQPDPTPTVPRSSVQPRPQPVEAVQNSTDAEDSILTRVAQFIRATVTRVGTAAVRAALLQQGFDDAQINRAAGMAGVNLQTS